MQSRRTLIPGCVISVGSKPISLNDKASVDIYRYNKVVVANNALCFHEIISVRFAKFSISTSKSIRIDSMSLKDQSPLPYFKLRSALPDRVGLSACSLKSSTPHILEKNWSAKALIRPMLGFLLRRPKRWGVLNNIKCKTTYELYEHFAKVL
jgi:hypothetical protein